MKVFLIRDTLKTGIVKEAVGHFQTGHSDNVQVNGNYTKYSSVHRKGEWFATMEEAKKAVRIKLIEREEYIERQQAELLKENLFIQHLKRIFP